MHWPRKWFMRISSEKVGQKDTCHMNAVLFQSWKGRKLWMCAYVCINLCKSLGKQRGAHTKLKLIILRMRLVWTGVRQTIEERTNLRGSWRREGETIRDINRLPTIPSQEKTPTRVYLFLHRFPWRWPVALACTSWGWIHDLISLIPHPLCSPGWEHIGIDGASINSTQTCMGMVA